jgi:hypothetical protein
MRSSEGLDLNTDLVLLTNLLLSCLSMSSGFITGAKLFSVIIRFSQNLSFWRSSS